MTHPKGSWWLDEFTLKKPVCCLMIAWRLTDYYLINAIAWRLMTTLIYDCLKTASEKLVLNMTFVMIFLRIILRYRTRAIISCGLYIFYSISKDHFFVFKEVFSENSVLMYGLYSRAASNQERLIMACVHYITFL